MLILSADLSIRPKKIALASPHSSSSFFFNGVFERVFESLSMNSTLLIGQIHHHYKAKIAVKTS